MLNAKNTTPTLQIVFNFSSPHDSYYLSCLGLKTWRKLQHKLSVPSLYLVPINLLWHVTPKSNYPCWKPLMLVHHHHCDKVSLLPLAKVLLTLLGSLNSWNTFMLCQCGSDALKVFTLPTMCCWPTLEKLTKLRFVHSIFKWWDWR